MNDVGVLPFKEGIVKKEQNRVDNSCCHKVLISKVVSLIKQIASNKVLVVLLLEELGKENSSYGNINGLKITQLTLKRHYQKM